MIGGNIEALFQKVTGSINHIGERSSEYRTICKLSGWLDLSSGDSKYTHDEKLQESTHIFITDYVVIDRDPKDKRLSVRKPDGTYSGYDVLLIDDPMELHQHLEIYLRYLG